MTGEQIAVMDGRRPLGAIVSTPHGFEPRGVSNRRLGEPRRKLRDAMRIVVEAAEAKTPTVH